MIHSSLRYFNQNTASQPDPQLWCSRRLFSCHRAPSSRAVGFMIPSPKESGNIEMYSPAFYATCTAGGILSGGLTHMTITHLDLVKCNMQIDPAKNKSILSGFGVLLELGFGLCCVI